MIIDDTIIVAILLLVGATVSLTMTRLSTRLTLALVGTILTLTFWALLNLVPLELAINSQIPGLSTLLKSLALMAILFLGNLFLDGMGKNYARGFRRTVPVVLTVWKIVAWLAVRDDCAPLAEGLSLVFTHCAYKEDYYAVGDAVINVAIAVMILAALTVLAPLVNPHTSVGHTMTVFLIEAILVLTWLTVATIGIWQFYTEGRLADWQYAVRPPLAITIVILNIIAVLYLPLRASWDAVVFRRRIQPLTAALETKAPGPDIQTGNLTTRTMDHLGISLESIGAPVQNSSSDENAQATAQWLLGSGNPPAGVPISESVWMQRSWLLQVARRLTQ